MQMLGESAQNWVTFGAIALLTLFGWWWSTVITRLNHKGYLEGYTGFAIAIWVLVTLILAMPLHRFAVVDQFVNNLFAFIASGLPMLAQDVRRYVLARQAEQNAIAGNGGGDS